MLKGLVSGFVCIICISGIVFANPGEEFKSGSEPDGFRGIKWGQDVLTVQGLEYVKTDPSYGGIQLYTRKGDELKIGGAQLESITYGFWKGKFCVVSIDVKGSVNYYGLKDTVFERFGRGYQSNELMEEYGVSPFVWTKSSSLRGAKKYLGRGDLFSSFFSTCPVNLTTSFQVCQ